MNPIKGLYETHLYVTDIERSIKFYTEVLSLKQCYYEDARKAAFFWIGEDKQAMLGLWEKPISEIDVRHFAFQCDPMWVLLESESFLKSHDIDSRNFLNDETKGPMVFAWMPAISIYFADPDGHSLEFIGILEGESKPENGVISYNDWLRGEQNA